MHIDEVELRVIRLPYKAPFKTSFGAESEKNAVPVRVRSEGIEGYGEGVMEPVPLYREETITGGLGLLRDVLVPWLLANGCSHPRELSDAWAHWRANHMTKASLELAVWDLHARQQETEARENRTPARQRRGSLWRGLEESDLQRRCVEEFEARSRALTGGRDVVVDENRHRVSLCGK